MSVNFPLFLVMATGLTGLIWLVDVLFLRKKRQAAVARVVDGTVKVAKTNPEGSVEQAAETLGQRPVVVEYSAQFFPVLLLVLVLRSFLAEPFQIPTGSMIPTLKIGDFILVNKFAYGIRLPVIGTKVFDVGEPKNGDVMVFIPPHEDEYFIKRVIGIPGDKVRYEDKTLYINGVKQAQKFVAKIPLKNPKYVIYEETLGGVNHLIHKNGYRDKSVQEWVIPKDRYLMMGDNRDRSHDGRHWGYATKDNIVGKAFAVWMHKEPGFNLPTFSTTNWIK